MKGNTVTVTVTVLQHVTSCRFVRGVNVCSDVDVFTKLYDITSLKTNTFTLPQISLRNHITQ